MDAILGGITSETAQVVVVAAIGAAWAAFKGSDLWSNRLKTRNKWIAEIIAAVVAQVYATYVRGLKATASDGKLLPEQKNTAMQLAVVKVREATDSKMIPQTPLQSDLVLRSAIEAEVANQKSRKWDGKWRNPATL